eukprot:5396941-Pleurochrysis_carterae.AAC.3
MSTQEYKSCCGECARKDRYCCEKEQSTCCAQASVRACSPRRPVAAVLRKLGRPEALWAAQRRAHHEGARQDHVERLVRIENLGLNAERQLLDEIEKVARVGARHLWEALRKERHGRRRNADLLGQDGVEQRAQRRPAALLERRVDGVPAGAALGEADGAVSDGEELVQQRRERATLDDVLQERHS